MPYYNLLYLLRHSFSHILNINPSPKSEKNYNSLSNFTPQNLLLNSLYIGSHFLNKLSIHLLLNKELGLDNTNYSYPHTFYFYIYPQ